MPTLNIKLEAEYEHQLNDKLEALLLERTGNKICLLADGQNELLKEARAIIERDYREDVNSIVDDIVDAIRTRQIDDSEQLVDRVHEDVDGSSRVSDTYSAEWGVVVSPSSHAAFEDGMVDTSSFKGGVDWSLLMSAAMERDVIDELDARDIKPQLDWPFGLELFVIVKEATVNFDYPEFWSSKEWTTDIEEATNYLTDKEDPVSGGIWQNLEVYT